MSGLPVQAGRSGRAAPGRRIHHLASCRRIALRSLPISAVMVPKSAQSSSLNRTMRCLFLGAFGTGSSVPGVRTIFQATPLRCTYTDATVMYVHLQACRNQVGGKRMAAIMERYFRLLCNTTGCNTPEFRGKRNESRAAVRKRAAKAGWTHVRSDWGRAFDTDLCPACQPEEGGGDG